MATGSQDCERSKSWQQGPPRAPYKFTRTLIWAHKVLSLPLLQRKRDPGRQNGLHVVVEWGQTPDPQTPQHLPTPGQLPRRGDRPEEPILGKGQEVWAERKR